MSKKTNGKEQAFNQALNAAATNLLNIATSNKSTLDVIHDQLTQLKLRGGIYLLDEDNETLRLKLFAYPKKLLSVIERIEKSTGIQTEHFAFTTSKGDAFHEINKTNKPIFLENSKSFLVSLLPKQAKRFKNQIAEAFGSLPMIIAPLRGNSGIFGICYIADENLEPTDIPAIDAFANQIAVALQNDQLYSSLKESEKKYRDLVEKIHDGIWVVDQNGYTTFANDFITQLLGYTAEEMLQMRILDFVEDGETKESAKKALVQRTNGEKSKLEMEFLRKDGTKVCCSISATPIIEDGYKGAYAIVHDISEQKKSGKIKEAIYRISKITTTVPSLEALFPQIHEIVGSVMSADNFYIALYDDQKNMINFPYYIDEIDKYDLPTPPQKMGRGLTEYILRTGKSLLCDIALEKELVSQGKIEIIGGKSQIWLGVPLVVEGKNIGVMVVQHYSNPAAYGAAEQEMLEYVSLEIAKSIHHKMSEDALRESEENLRSLIEQSPISIEIFNPEGTMVSTNKTWEKMWGVKKDAVIDKFNVFKDKGIEEMGLLPLMERVFNGETVSIPEVFYTAPDNPDQSRYLQTLYYPLKNDDGSIRNIVVLNQDITEQKLAGIALQESETRYRTLSSATFEGIGISKKGVLVDINEQFAEIFGYKRDELIGREITSLVYPEDVEIVRKKIFEESEEKYEARVFHKTGKIIDLEVRGKRAEKDGHSIRIAVIRDITTSKKTTKTLQEQVASNKQILETTLDGFILADLEGNLIDLNPAYEKMIGYSRNELLGMNITKIEVNMSPEMVGQRIEKIVAQGYDFFETRHRCKDKSVIDIEVSICIMQRGEQPLVAAFVRDVTERKIAETTLLASEEKYRSLFDTVNDAIITIDSNGIISSWNNKAESMFGYSSNDVIGQALTLIMPEQYREAHTQGLERVVSGGKKNVIGKAIELMGKKKNGDEFPFEISLAENSTDAGYTFTGFLRDISERKEAEKMLIASENRFRNLFENTPIGLGLADTEGNLLDFNNAMMEPGGYSREDIEKIGNVSGLYYNKKDRKFILEEFQEKGILRDRETRFKTKDGGFYTAQLSLEMVHVDDKPYILAQVKDITEQLQANETILLQSTALESAANGIMITDREGSILWANRALTEITGFSQNDLLGQNPRIFKSGSQPPDFYKDLWETILAGETWQGQMVNKRKNNSTYVDEQTITPVINEKGEITNFIAVKQDGTERIQREREMEAILSVSQALRSALNKEEMLPVILDKLMELQDSDGAALTIFDEVTEENVVELGGGVWEEGTGIRLPPGKGITAHVMKTGELYINNSVKNNPDRKDFNPELTSLIDAMACMPLITQRKIIGTLWLGRMDPITDQEIRVLKSVANIAANAISRSMLHEQTQKRLGWLVSLNNIDKAITGSHEFDKVLRVLLIQVQIQLAVDAASVLLIDKNSKLVFAGGQGFTSNGKAKSMQVELGESLAGRAAENKQLVHIPDLSQVKISQEFRKFVSAENFVSYFGVPLVAEENVIGVLEVYNRKPFFPDVDWIDFLETLAGEAAVALQTANLIENLKHSKNDLETSYAATLEGWVHGLDLRDNETVGHTKRVTEKTVQLAKVMGTPGEELEHIKRGALLHDIGKIGIPDSILLKPGKLNDAEWTIIKKHPVYAFEWLNPIKYLEPALDIPYSHHEKWDGTGYPRGLFGEEIPMAARIFAIVDVWDALSSDRPYRDAWPTEKVINHLKEQSGKHFEPIVVEEFMKLLKK